VGFLLTKQNKKAIIIIKRDKNMKITFGGHKRMTVTNQPYEPIQVESVLIIEKEVEDGTDIKSFEKLQEKVNVMLDKDLENKVKETIQSQQKTRNKMKSILREID